MINVECPIKNLKFKWDQQEVIKNIYDFLLENKLDEYTTLSMLRKALQTNFTLPDKNKEIYVNLLSDFNAFDKKNYIIKKEYWEYDLYDTFNLLHQSKLELLYILDETKPKVFEGYILKRRINPPLEAFELVGHNQLDIRPSGKQF